VSAPYVAVKGMRELHERFANGKETMRDFEIECEFWLTVEECEYCDEQLCSIHFERMVMCL
jgi:hypothetical protein